MLERRSKKKSFVETFSGSGAMFYSEAIKKWPKKAAFGVKLFYYNLWPQPYSLFLGSILHCALLQKLGSVPVLFNFGNSLSFAVFQLWVTQV